MSDLIENLPQSWESIRLNQIATVDWGNTSITKKSYIPAGFPAYSAAGQDGFVAHAEHHGPGIVVSAIGTVGISRWANGDWTAIKNTITVTDFIPGVEPKFAYYQSLSQNFWPVKGANQQFIPVTEAREIAFRLPPSNEQRRIAAKLDTLQSRTRLAREALAAIPTLLDQYQQSVLATILTGKCLESHSQNDEAAWPSQTLESLLKTGKKYPTESSSQVSIRLVEFDL